MSFPYDTPSSVIKSAPRYFWLLFFIFTVSAGVLFLDHFRTYVSRVTILVIHKNEKTAASADQVVKNIMEIPKTLSFYERLLKQFPEVKDPWVGLSGAERESLWMERVSVERVDTSGLFRLSIDADNPSDASLLVKKSAANLFQSVGRYYDIRTDIDIRTVDAPVASVRFSHPFGWFLSSLSAGFVLAAIVSSVFTVFSRNMDRFRRYGTALPERKEVFEGDLAVEAKPDQFTESFPEAEPIALVSEISAESSSKKPEPETVSVEPSFSSSNLPFLEEGVSLEEHLFGSGVSSVEPESNVSDPASESVAVKESVPAVEDVEEKRSSVEPTPEELKRRLNQLLRGEM